MVDTVKLFTHEFDIKKKHKFIKRPDINCDGEIVSEKTLCNLNGNLLDIKKDYKGQDTLYFQTSLPKLLYKTSFYEVKENDLERAIKAIEKELSCAGVIIDKNNLGDFEISRLDFCRNIEVDYNITDYLIYLDSFYYSRRLKTEIKKETVLYKNKSQQLTFYNKIREILDTVKDQSILDLVQDRPENILRVESRLLKKRVILQELKSKMKFENIFNLEIAKKKILKDIDCLVRDSREQTEFSFEDNSKLLDQIKRETKRNINIKFLACRGTIEFLRDFNFDEVKIFEFYAEHFSRAQAYRNMADIRYFKSIMTDKKQRNLLNEIRYKIAA